MHLHLTEVSDRHCLHADIPQLQSAPTLTSTTNVNTTMVSWSPTEFAPKSYTISYSCQLICGSSVTQQTITVNGSLTTKIITTDPGSSCVFYLTAEFGNSIVSNIVISSTNTTSAGRIYNTIVISISWIYI